VELHLPSADVGLAPVAPLVGVGTALAELPGVDGTCPVESDGLRRKVDRLAVSVTDQHVTAVSRTLVPQRLVALDPHSTVSVTLVDVGLCRLERSKLLTTGKTLVCVNLCHLTTPCRWYLASHLTRSSVVTAVRSTQVFSTSFFEGSNRQSL